MTGRLDGLLDRTVLLSYTNLGYHLRPWTGDPLPRMDGKTVIVTGPTSGLGLATARMLDELGASLVLVGRSPEKLDRVQRSLGGEHAVEVADLSLISEVADLADRLNRLDQIDALINNAGAMFPERAETDEGLERSFALNLLSPYLLTRRLIPKLAASAPSRVIFVSSGGMYTQRLKVRDLQFERGEYSPAGAYARAKRGQVVLTELLAEELEGSGVVVHAMHPGWADTDGVKGALPLFRKIVGPFLRSADQGADTIAWLAAAPEAAETSGAFWLDRRPRLTHYSDKTEASEADRRELMVRLDGVAAEVLGATD